MGEGVIKNGQKNSDFFYGWPLRLKFLKQYLVDCNTFIIITVNFCVSSFPHKITNFILVYKFAKLIIGVNFKRRQILRLSFFLHLPNYWNKIALPKVITHESCSELSLHCKCLQGITGCLQVFPVVGKLCDIYRLQGNPMIIMEFPHNL